MIPACHLPTGTGPNSPGSSLKPAEKKKKEEKWN
jgi:hypothetical protein